MSEAITTPAAPASTPSAPAAPAASTATPAAASAPAAAVTAPATTEGAAPAVVTATPVAADAPKFNSTLEAMQAAQAAKEAETAAAAAAPVKTPEEIAAEAAAAETKTPEEIAAEAAAAEAVAAAATPEEKKGEEGDDDLPNFDDFELDAIALAPKELAAKIKADPALEAALENSPLRDELFANARLAAETSAFKEVFGSPEEAKVAADGHAAFTGITTAMAGVADGDMKTLQPVMAAMLEASAVRDAEGKLQFHPNGALVTNGVVGKFLRNSFEQKLELLGADFTKAGDEEGQAAIDILMERAGLRTPSSANKGEVSPEVQAQLDDLKTQREAFAAEKKAGAAETAKTHFTLVNTRIDKMMDAGIGSVLDRADGLTPFSRKTVENNIRTDLANQVKNNPRFQAEMDKLDAMPFGPDRQKQHMAIATRYFQTGLAKVAITRLAEAGAHLKAKEQAQANKSAARTEAARSEVRGATVPTKAAPVLSEREQFAAVEADLTKTLGRSPSNYELMSENLKRKSQQAA